MRPHLAGLAGKQPVREGEPPVELWHMLMVRSAEQQVHRGVYKPPDATSPSTQARDGAIVADVVAEWAGRHRQPFELTLSGPAGGTFAQGNEAERLELDAVEFCRVLSGRAERGGLLGVRVLF